MKILYILDYIPLGTRTFDDFLEKLLDAMGTRGWELRLVLAGDPAPGFAIKLNDHRVAWCVLPFPLHWRFRRRLAEQWPGYRPDLVYTSFLSVFNGPLVLARISGWMRYWVVSDESSGAADTSSWVKRVLRRLRGRLVGCVVDKVRTVSHYIARRDVEQMYLPAGKVATVWNGLRFERYPYRERSTDHPELRILFMGQITGDKGVFVLLDALGALHASGTPFVCRYAGEGAASKALVDQVRQLGLNRVVETLGFCSDPLVQYHWADVVVIPSVWAEAFGLVAIEAMATGAFVVVSDAGGLPEVVGDAGFVVPAGDAGALAEVLVQIVQDTGCIGRMGRITQQRARQMFQLDKTVEGIVHIFAKLSCGSEG